MLAAVIMACLTAERRFRTKLSAIVWKTHVPVAYVLNNLNRGLGQPDGYPFVLSTPVLEKLRYIHEVVGWAAESH